MVQHLFNWFPNGNSCITRVYRIYETIWCLSHSWLDYRQGKESSWYYLLAECIIFPTKILCVWFTLLHSFTIGVRNTTAKNLVNFPPKTRAALTSLLSGVFWFLNGSAKKKLLRSILSYCLHFLWFCKQHTLLHFTFHVDKEND